MIGLKTSIYGVKKVSRVLKDIEKKDVPAAKASAFARAGSTGTSKAAAAVAKWANVPKWMIAGVGAAGGGKKKGSRISRTKYIRRVDGIYVTFRSTHLNPVGTVRKSRKPRYTRRGVRVGKQSYPGSYIKNYKYSAAIYERGTGDGRLQKIQLGPRAEFTVRNTLNRVVPKVFKRRFEYEYNRRAKRRGTR